MDMTGMYSRRDGSSYNASTPSSSRGGTNKVTYVIGRGGNLSGGVQAELLEGAGLVAGQLGLLAVRGVLVDYALEDLRGQTELSTLNKTHITNLKQII